MYQKTRTTAGSWVSAERKEPVAMYLVVDGEESCEAHTLHTVRVVYTRSSPCCRGLQQSQDNLAIQKGIPILHPPVIAVMTLQPCTPRLCIACRSACMPAPPPESDPAMVHTMGGVDRVSPGTDSMVILLRTLWECPPRNLTLLDGSGMATKADDNVGRHRRLMKTPRQRGNMCKMMYLPARRHTHTHNTQQLRTCRLEQQGHDLVTTQYQETTTAARRLAVAASCY